MRRWRRICVRKTYELLQEGKSKQDVVDYMIARYGNFVTYNPPVMAVHLDPMARSAVLYRDWLYRACDAFAQRQ